MAKIKLATVWLGGCSGCHMSFLDLDEWLFELASQVELVYSPLADIKTYPDYVDVALVEGAIANQDHLEMIHQIRDRTKFLISFGDCAITGNVTAIRNTLGASESAESVLNRAYLEVDIQPKLPQGELVPTLLNQVISVHQVVSVDCYLPGCPPNAERIRAVLEPLLQGKQPELTGSELIRFG
ncbi:oxidoreductase [Leptolyngbya cf. ectocarpi LEGE 11479]|uniref:Oxidoreductase n=1 Tax=Leptolyngbya cf. ectocarpi LEGE 11479 TaxID=1828722 RepID=A0A929FCD4_LEPEC|nr:oxidoreductase [Leptolyngbya ectocarpi]MBE9069879.1 oxidoreductase [Leptolyngbya cf. ectocarpi LEGE 11479]